MYRFPATTGSSDDFLRALGAIWAHNVPQARAEAFAFGLACEYSQIQQTMTELLQCVNRLSIPEVHREHILPVMVTQVGDKCYQVQTQGIDQIALLADYIMRPTWILVGGMDFVFEDGQIQLHSDIELPQRCLAFGVTQYAEYQQEHLALLFDDLPPVVKPLTVMNALYDAMQGRTSQATLWNTLGGITGAPVAKEDEKVTRIAQDKRGYFVATNKNVYRCLTAPQVSEGDILEPGQPIDTTCEVKQLSPFAINVRGPIDLRYTGILQQIVGLSVKLSLESNNVGSADGDTPVGDIL